MAPIIKTSFGQNFDIICQNFNTEKFWNFSLSSEFSFDNSKEKIILAKYWIYDSNVCRFTKNALKQNWLGQPHYFDENQICESSGMGSSIEETAISIRHRRIQTFGITRAAPAIVKGLALENIVSNRPLFQSGTLVRQWDITFALRDMGAWDLIREMKMYRTSLKSTWQRWTLALPRAVFFFMTWYACQPSSEVVPMSRALKNISVGNQPKKKDREKVNLVKSSSNLSSIFNYSREKRQNFVAKKKLRQTTTSKITSDSKTDKEMSRIKMITIQ